jgi:two-component system sensor histidine kinase KdpD
MSLEDPIGGALTRLERTLAGRPVDLAIPPDLPAVRIDDVLIEHLLMNLLENVAKYTPPGSPIDITARVEGERVILEVADRGPGIPAGQEQRIFEKFVRGGEGGAGGFGLGLAICRAIAQAHGGTIVAVNRPGGGAVFRVSLPLEKEPARTLTQAEEEARA